MQIRPERSYKKTPSSPKVSCSGEKKLMYIEDIVSYNRISKKIISNSYNQGKKDMLSDITKEISNDLGISLPLDSFEDFIKSLEKLLSPKNKFNSVHSIQCGTYDLYRLIKDSERIINLAEQDLFYEGRVNLNNFKIDLKVKKTQSLQPEKKEIAQAFNDATDTALDDTSKYILSLKQEIEDLKILSAFQIRFQDFDTKLAENFSENPKPTKPIKSLGALTKDIILYKNQQKFSKIIQDQEWEKQEVNYIKEKYTKKKEKLKNRKIELLDLEKNLKKRNLEIEREKDELDRLKEFYYKKKKKISSFIEQKSKKISEAISEIAINFDSIDSIEKVSTETDITLDISYKSDTDALNESYSQEIPDPQILQRKIYDLESQYRSGLTADAQQKVQKEIDLVKNNLANIRAYNIIKTSQANQKKFNMLAVHNSLSDSSLKHKKNIRPDLALLSPRYNLTSSITSPKVVNDSPSTSKTTSKSSFTDVFVKESQMHRKVLDKHLKAREIKLKEKEDQLDRDSQIMIEKWNKIPLANEAIPFIQKEILEYIKKKQELAKVIKNYKRKELHLNLKIEEFDIKQKDIENKNKEICEFKQKINEKRLNIISNLGKLQEELEKFN
jgi:hypothetical protein